MTKKNLITYEELKADLRNLKYEYEDLAKKYCKTKKQKELWFEIKCVLEDAESGIDEVIEENL